MGHTEGSGYYYWGDTITIAAIPNNSYRFVHWQDGDTSNPRIVIVSPNDTLYTAYFEYVPQPLTEGALPGLFSVSDTEQVYFSQGNLQYQASTDTWRFAEHQYDYVGSDNSNIGSTYSGWIDLFGWGTGSNPTLHSRSNSDYNAFGFVDWGINAISNGGNEAGIWRSLTTDEMNYILSTRSNAASKYGTGRVNGVGGLIILPDEWQLPDGCSFNAGTSNSGWTRNNYTTSQWEDMEAAGAVFLPAAGERRGTSVMWLQSDYLYWSSTPYSSNNAYAWHIYGHYYDMHPQSPSEVYRGFSVRLVRDHTSHGQDSSTVLLHHIYFDSVEHGTLAINGSTNITNGMPVIDSTVITITITPDSWCQLQYLIVNGDTVNSPYTMTVTSDVIIQSSIIANLPELHVSSLSCSDIVAGQNFNVSWTIRNDGNVSTPIGATWNDMLLLSTVPYINYDIDEPTLLGSWENVSALDTGQSYTRTITTSLPLRHGSGQYYLFLLTDTWDAYNIQWPDSTVSGSYNPPPYIMAVGSHGSIMEISELGNSNMHDNFNMKPVQVTIPPLADLEVTNIVRPTNFYSGTQVSVTATITNTGDAPTLSDGWRDVLYISTSPTFSASSALQLASTWHTASTALAPDSSYQVTFSGTAPLTWYGEAYFYVTTDQDDNEYEHIANDNNTSRSDVVNIFLTPPADLVVSNVTVPALASNQLPFSMSYTVTNAGMGAPNVNNWIDRVYLSTSPTIPAIQFDASGWYWDDYNWQDYSYNTIADTVNWCYLMESNYHTDGLAAGTSYTMNRNYTFPSFITRAETFYFIVVTDANNNVFEYQSENNNTTASNASAISFFFPDLVVDTLIVPDSIDNNHSFTITYTIANHGLGKAEGSWDNCITISGNQLDLTTYNGTLMPGENYTISRTCTMPPYYTSSMSRPVTVTADYYNNIDEKTAENNNSTTATTYATIYKPNFYLSDIQIPDTIVINHSVNFSFTIHNNGQKGFDGNLYYSIYYSTDSVLTYDWDYPTNAYWLYGSEPYINIPSGGSQQITQTLLFPNGMTDSDYYLYIIVNPGGYYVSEENLQDNTLRGGTYYLCHRPLPDLVLCNVGIPDTLQAGQPASITFDVVNQGETTVLGAANLSATRCLTTLTTNGSWCPVQLQTVPFPAGYVTLSVGDTIHYIQSVLVPPTLSGNAAFSLNVDASNNIMELNENNNDTTLTRFVNPIPFDIGITSITAPINYTTGDTLDISWTVNISDTTAIYNHTRRNMTDATGYASHLDYSPQASGTLWHDRLYLSTDNTLSDGDVSLGDIAVTTNHISDTSYTVGISAVMPHSHTGILYLIASCDNEAAVIETNRSNNILSYSINATLAPMPNLQITSLVVDDTVTQRQGCLVRYTVTNNGSAPTRSTQWTDKFYCASLLATNSHEGVLLPGESYTDSVEVVIPPNLLGVYTFQAFTDADNTVYEHDGENDNSLTRPVLVLQAPPCDLIVTNVEATATAVVGSAITVSWTVQNIGDNTVSGYVKDGIYLSLDTVFDNSDVLIGTLSYHNSFASFGSTQRTLNCTVQGVTAGDYYVIVRTNIMRAFNEVSFDNNSYVNATTTEVSLPTLIIGQPENITLTSGSQTFYRMEVGTEYAGQTLSLTLTTEATNAFNGIYLAHEYMPSAAHYDYGASVPYAMQQQILVPTLRQGTYYILASASTTNRAPQPITLLAEIIDFEILHLNTASGTNTGSVTTKVTGAKFDTIMDFRLVDSSGYTPAQKVKFENSTQSYVTFNLTDLPAGTYHVEAELPGGVVTMKENAFVVEQGLPAELAVNIVAPSSVRVGNNTTVNIEYGNNGSTDLNVSGFMVVSANGHPIGLTVADLANQQDTLTFSTAEPGMDPDIIRPNYFATKTIYVSAASAGTISIYVYPIRRRYE